MNRWTWLLTGIAALLLCGLFGCGGDPPSPAGSVEGTVTVETGEAAAGSTVDFLSTARSTNTDAEGTFVFDDVEPGSYTLIVRRSGYTSNRSEIEVTDGDTTDVEIVLEEKNEPPRIGDIAVNPRTVPAGGTVALTVAASDPNPDTLTYSFSTTGGFAVDSSSDNTATLSAPSDSGVTETATVDVTDEDGALATERIAISTAPNTPPDITGLEATPQTLQPGQTATLSTTATDPESEDLTYEWSAPEPWSIDDPSGPETTVTAPDSFDTSGVIELTVTDGADAATSAAMPLSTVANGGPQIVDVGATTSTIVPEGSTTLGVEATDPDGQQLDYTWSVPGTWSIDDSRAQNPTLTAPNAYDRTARITVDVQDQDGKSTTGSLLVSTRQNQPPIIQDISVDPERPVSGETADLNVDAADPEGASLTYTWSTNSNGWYIPNSYKADPSVQVPLADKSSTLISVEVTDGSGQSTTRSMAVQSARNSDPQVSSVYPSKNPVSPNASITMTAQASDPNGQPLNYAWSVDDPAWSIGSGGDTVSLDAPDTHGTSTRVTVTATDGHGGSTESTSLVRTSQGSDGPTITSAPILPYVLPAGRGPTFTYQAQAKDPDDSNLSWSITSNPTSTISIDENTGKVTWKPALYNANKTFTFTITVTDGTTTASQNFTIPTSDTSFTSSSAYAISTGPMPYSGNDAIAVADFDGDGLTDLAGTLDTDADLGYVLSGDSYGTQYDVSWTGTAPFSECTVDVEADLDGDGTPDVVSACAKDASGSQQLGLATWINNIPNGGAITSNQYINTGATGYDSEPQDVAALDINSDGADEIILADESGTLYLYDNDGTGTLSKRRTHAPSYLSEYTIEQIHVGNFENFYPLEFLILENHEENGYPEAQIRIIPFTEDYQTGKLTLKTSGNQVEDLEYHTDKVMAGDFAGNGELGFVYKKSSYSDSEIVLVEHSHYYDFEQSDERGTFLGPDLHYDSDIRSIATADVDLDGRTDVIVSTGHNARLFVGFGKLGPELSTLSATSSATYGDQPADDLYVGQFNNDPYPDIFAYRFDRFSVFH